MDIIKSINDLINKADGMPSVKPMVEVAKPTQATFKPSYHRQYKREGAYVPVRTIVHKKDGSLISAIRWKKLGSEGLGRVKSNKQLPALRNTQGASTFNRYSAIKQTMFLLADEITIDEIHASNFIPTTEYQALGVGIYLYSDLDIAKDRAEALNKEVLPVKVDVAKVYNTTLNNIQNENLDNIKNLGYEAIGLMRDEAQKFDLFCLDNRDIVVIGEQEEEEILTDEIKKAIEDYELEDVENTVTKEYLQTLKCVPFDETEFQPTDIKKNRPKPAPLNPDGSVDYDGVKAGESIWVTVKQESSPLYGRPVIITKKPDGMFALTGGSGFTQIKNQNGLKTRTDALRHMTMEGRPTKTAADEEFNRIQDENEKSNEPLIAQRQDLMLLGRQQVTDAMTKFDSIAGINETNKVKLKKQYDSIVDLGKQGGLDEEISKHLASEVIRRHTSTNRQVAEKHRRDAAVRIKKLAQLKQVTPEMIEKATEDLQFNPITINVNPKSFKGKTKEEITESIADKYDEAFADLINPNKDDKSLNEELKAEGIKLDASDKDQESVDMQLGDNIDSLKIQNPEDVKDFVALFNTYYETRKKYEEIKKKIKPVNAKRITPSMLEQMRVEMSGVFDRDISPEELEDIKNSYDSQHTYNNNAISLYKAASSIWNDEKSLRQSIDRTDNSYGGYVNNGATSALAAISGFNLDERMDVTELIDKTSVEAATMAMAFEYRDKLRNTPGAYDELIKRVENYNNTNIPETEKRALDRHAILKKRYQNIQDAKKIKLLEERETSGPYKEFQIGMVEGEVDNLIEQKKNLGNAIGSMQASANFLNSLLIARNAKDDAVEINFGEDIKGAELRQRELGLFDRKGRIDPTDPKNIKLITGASSLHKYMKTIPITKKEHTELEDIKTNMKDTVTDNEGNVFANNYDVPFWNQSYRDDEGNEKQYKSRVEQRNDIEFLKRKGNGLITRVTGAGKTNTSLGFLANKIKENPNYSALIVVPGGRSGQWLDEAKKFTDPEFVNRLVILPDKKEDRNVVLANMKPGQIGLISHKDAVTSYYDLEQHYNSKKFNGLIIDEPQEIVSRSVKGNMSSATRKIMKLDAENRIALTATPARDNLIEAYDLVNWVSHKDKKLGPRNRFQDAYGGYGSGTNAQDAALQQLIFREISPYLSGDRLTNPNFKVKHNDILVKKTAIQDANMKKIEAGAKEYINQAKERYIQDILNDPDPEKKRLRHWESMGKGWKNIAAQNAIKKARETLIEQHYNNLSGISDNMTWQDNPKISTAVQNIIQNKDKKHVIFLDNRKQRMALHEALLSSGYTKDQIKNLSSTISDKLTSSRMAQEARDFKTNDKARIIFIDKKSSSGYNLQEGDDLHVLGTPSDAANYMQAQGRLARMPRKGDVNVHTYKYEDVPFDDRKWTRLEQQLAILKATAPGLMRHK